MSKETKQPVEKVTIRTGEKSRWMAMKQTRRGKKQNFIPLRNETGGLEGL